MNYRVVFAGIALAFVGAVALFGYAYWVKFQHWHEVCYPAQRMCFHGRYVNWSTLEFDRVFWSPTSHSLDGCPLVLVIRGEAHKLADLSPREMVAIGAEPKPTSDGKGIVWQLFPSSDTAYELGFNFSEGRLVSFSIVRRIGRILAGQEAFQLVIDDKPLGLPITEEALATILGPPEVKRRQLMWP